LLGENFFDRKIYDIFFDRPKLREETAAPSAVPDRIKTLILCRRAPGVGALVSAASVELALVFRVKPRPFAVLGGCV